MASIEDQLAELKQQVVEERGNQEQLLRRQLQIELKHSKNVTRRR